VVVKSVKSHAALDDVVLGVKNAVCNVNALLPILYPHRDKFGAVDVAD
jgi:hypothetical protein